MLETAPDSPGPSTVPINDVLNQREWLAVLVSTGKAVKRLTEKEVAKFYKRYEAYVGNKTTETLIDSFLIMVSKLVGTFVSIDDVKELQKDLKNDYIINQELSSVTGSRSLRCGRLLALLSQQNT